MGCSVFFGHKLESPSDYPDLLGYIDTIQTWQLPAGMG